jgi:glycosyltransferase involved in cell wall biosynthesis
MKLSLVIPCYNEASNLAALVERCMQVADSSGGEVILVDNGSTDETAVTLAALLKDQSAVRSIRVEVNQGYGFGILAGLASATGEVLAWTHADMQTDPMDVLQGLAMFRRHKQPSRLFVKGRRYGRPISDVVFTVGMSVFETLLLRETLQDINAQPTMFGRAVFQSWKNAPSDFSLDLYAYYQAKRAALIVQRIPVRYGKRAHGVSHWNVNWRSKLRFIRRTVTYSWHLARSLSQP